MILNKKIILLVLFTITISLITIPLIKKKEKFEIKRSIHINKLNKVHLVLYSQGEPFDSTKKKLIKTIKRFTKREVIIHNYDLNRIKQSSWWNKIKELPYVKNGNGRRDGYYCVYKAFCTHEVYQNMDETDILYYVDSSQYYKNGFTQNIDRLCDTALQEGIIAGSVGNDIKNNSFGCCDNLKVWNKILPDHDNSKRLNNMHVLASWFILTKNNINTQFMNDWIYWCMYKDDELTNPLITYHHPGDQSIFNILVYKYNFKVFYHKNIDHDRNKDRNKVLKIINENKNIDKYFIHL